MSNKKSLKKVLVSLSLPVFLFSEVAQAETLNEALAFTYVANPAILSQRAYLRSVYEKITQSQSGYKPVVSGNASYGYQYNRTKSSPIFSEQESDPVAFGVTAMQNVFSGFGTVSAVKASKEKFKSEIANLKNVEQKTLNEGVSAYTGVIQALAILRLNEHNEAVLKRQHEYTNDRFLVGELTKTDVAQAKARYTGAVAGRITAQGNVKVAYADYQKVIGKMPDKIFEPDAPDAKIPQSLEEVLAVALKDNPVVQAAEMQEKSANSVVDQAKSDYYPSLDIQASYMNSKSGAHGSAYYGGAYIETGEARAENSSVMLVMDVPLYQAGNVSSRVRESKYIAGQAKINVNTAKREVIRLTTKAWEDYQSIKASLSSLEEQVLAATLALEGVRYEEEAGTRTVLDVLDAEQELLDANVDVVKAKKNLIDASYRLLAAMGKMTPEELGLDIARYRKVDGAEVQKNS